MVRVLLCGDVAGQLPLLCEHVKKFNAKLPEAQRFKAVFCVGDFSSEEMDLEVEPPIPIHFIDSGPACGDLIAESPQGDELMPGLHFLGHFGVTKVEGLSVAFLSGRYRSDLFPEEQTESAAEKDKASEPEKAPVTWEELRAAEKLAEVAKSQLYVDGCYYTPLAIERLMEDIADSGGVDLLLTSEWPTGCHRGVPKEKRSEIDKASYQRCASPAVSKLAVAAEPKYHAVGLGGCFWRRPPWTHERRGEVVAATGQLRCGTCRMVALGAASDVSSQALSAPAVTKKSDDKDTAVSSTTSPTRAPQKWLHGLDLDADAPPAAADDATPSPWSLSVVPNTAPEVAGPARLDISDCLQGEERRRWIQRFGVLPTEMQSAADKIVKESQPKEKKEKRQSIYFNQKSDKRFKAGKGSGDHFHQKERRAANGKSAGSYF